MFDVLVYLYENYWRPDACPDHDQLSRKLTAVGFESDEIQEALHWLDGLADTSQGYTGEQSEDAIRLYSDREIESLGETSVGFVTFLESAGVLPPPMREMVIDRAMAAGGNPLDLDDMKIIILMVFWSLGEEPDALILDELFVAPEERLIHRAPVLRTIRIGARSLSTAGPSHTAPTALREPLALAARRRLV